MTRRERWERLQLPERTVQIAPGEHVVFRALPGDVGQDLVDAVAAACAEQDAPVTDEVLAPHLMAACEVVPDGEDRLDAQWWLQMRPRLPTGVWADLRGAVLDLNDRTPTADLGKG